MDARSAKSSNYEEEQYMYVVIANFGNDSIALLEWVKQRSLQHVFVLSVDTGWAAPEWDSRVEQVNAYLKQCHFTPVRLTPEYDFQQLVRERNNFPSVKFHWCAKFLKGMPILDWLDEVDPDLKATILLAKRREQAPSLCDLSEYIEESHSYGLRKIWHPLYLHDLNARNKLIKQAGFDLLRTRSLECDPCIYNQKSDFVRLNNERKQLLLALEAAVGKPMFANPIEEDADLAGGDKAIYYKGCGSEFACGD